MKIIFGSGIFILVLIVLLIISVKIGEARFNNMVDGEIKEILNMSETEDTVKVEEDDIRDMPEPVKRWLKYSEVIGKQRVKTVRLKQEGRFKTSPDNSWMPYTAEQYYNAENPAFVWKVKMKAGPGVFINGRDKYYEGRGHMLIKLLSIFNVADARGTEMDQGTLLRFLNEIMWFPSAATYEYIEWEEIDNNSARAVINYGDLNASAVFYFNEKGEMIDFKADRYMERDGKYSLEEWRTPITDYDKIVGKNLATAGKGIWKLDSGDFNYIKLNITDIEYNIGSTY
ncbi:MAG: DUF6544 family protein [Halanaerobiales bacterium]